MIEGIETPTDSHETKGRGSPFRFWAIAVAICLALLVYSVYSVARVSIPFWRYNHERSRIKEIVASWELAPLNERRPNRWDAAWLETYNAVGNVCFSERQVSYDEICRIRIETERMNEQPLQMETLKWMWARLQDSGQYGKTYTGRRQRIWDELTGDIKAEQTKNSDVVTDAEK
jgi:hypothetical protein